MYRIIELTVKTDKIKNFAFLKNSPTRVVKKGDFYKFYYFEPIGTYITPFKYKGVLLNVIDGLDLNADVENNWLIVRDNQIIVASQNLIEVLEALETHQIKRNQTGTGLILDGWILNTITYGIYTPDETIAFLKSMFLAGYDFDQVIGLFSAIVKKKELARLFIDKAKILYEEATIWKKLVS